MAKEYGIANVVPWQKLVGTGDDETTRFVPFSLSVFVIHGKPKAKFVPSGDGAMIVNKLFVPVGSSACAAIVIKALDVIQPLASEKSRAPFLSNGPMGGAPPFVKI
jgi:hypothetical protein